MKPTPLPRERGGLKGSPAFGTSIRTRREGLDCDDSKVRAGPEPGGARDRILGQDSGVSSPGDRFRPLVLLQCSLGYLGYGLSKAAFLLLAFPIVLALTPFPRAKRRFLDGVVNAYLVAFTRGFLPAIGVYRVREIVGREHIPTDETVVYAVNHRGVIDALLVRSFLPRTAVVLKTRYARWPVLRNLVRHFDFVDIGAGSMRTLAIGMERCEALLAEGRSLLVFPEGTRAASGRLQPFKDAAFRLACAAGVRVVPVVIHSTYPFMAKVPGSYFPREHVDYTLEFFPPLTPGEGGPGALSDQTRRLMSGELARLDAGTFWELQKGPAHAHRTTV